MVELWLCCQLFGANGGKQRRTEVHVGRHRMDRAARIVAGEGKDMKRRIRKIKDRLYPMFIDEAIRRKAWEPVRIAQARFSEAMRDAYAKARAGLEWRG